ncbi:hypothetical protein D3C73_1101890 [compost metagenome]
MRKQPGSANAQAMNDFVKNHTTSVPIQIPHHRFVHRQTNPPRRQIFSRHLSLRIRQRISLQTIVPTLPGAIELFRSLKQFGIRDLTESGYNTAVSLPYKKSAAS